MNDLIGSYCMQTSTSKIANTYTYIHTNICVMDEIVNVHKIWPISWWNGTGVVVFIAHNGKDYYNEFGNPLMLCDETRTSTKIRLSDCTKLE